MAKKHKHPEHENLERWLVSYADFMTLLFATFTALYAMAQSDAAKMKSVAEAIREGFQEQSIISGIKSVLQGQSPPSENPDPIAPERGAGPGILGKFDSMVYKPGEVKDIDNAVNEMRSELEKINREIEAENKKNADAHQGDGEAKTPEDANTALRGVEVSVQERGMRISMDSRLLFPPGNAALKPAAQKFLDTVAPRIKKFMLGHMIQVEGHTDNQPISTGIYPSNWELSAARASSVIRYFITRHQFSPSSMIAVGYAATQPLTTNDTAEGRNRNRRVDIIIFSEKMSQQVNPTRQFVREVGLIHAVEDAPQQMPEPVTILPSKSGGKSKDPDAPVKVIIREADGTERPLIPKTEPVRKPAPPKDMGKADLHSGTTKPAETHASPATHHEGH